MSEPSNHAVEEMVQQGFSSLREGGFEEAIESFSAAHLLATDDDRPLRGRGLAYLQLGNSTSAESDFLRACQLNGHEPENAMGLGVCFALQNKIYDALKIYEELIIQHPDFIPGYLQLGRLHLKIGAITKGRDVFKEALSHRPTLVQRRTIEAILKEQDQLDKRRYYRPDFERLSKERGEPGFIAFLRKAFKR
jgi:tetratricopeptide (TPR) repeat protein